MQKITPYLFYEDVDAMLGWLEEAFGFRETLRLVGDAGYVNHAEMELDGAAIMLGDPGPDYQNPKRSGQSTFGTYVYVDDVDAHFERAKGAGATVVREPKDEDYGDRRYDVKDPEGHYWFFAQQVRQVEPAEWGATSAGAR